MMARKLDGRIESQRLLGELKAKISQSHRPITLATILVGQRFDSALYVKLKRKAAASVGIRTEAHQLPKNVSQLTLHRLLQRLNTRLSIQGILLQLPLPRGLNPDAAVSAIDPGKDVDGFHPKNRRVVPPPVAAVLHLLKLARPRRRSTVVVIAKPTVFTERLVQQLKQRGHRVIAENAVKRIPNKTRRADVVIMALGRGPMLRPEHVKPGSILIDVGTRRRNGRVVGDISPRVWSKAKAVSPVPGGVGPLTVAYLLKNTLTLATKNPG